MCLRFPFISETCARRFGWLAALALLLGQGELSALEELPLTKNLCENPGTAQLAAFRPFSEPLWPTTENPTAAQNAAIETLLRSFSTLEPFAPGILERLAEAEADLIENPDSPWNPSLRLNLGLIYYQEGFFSRGLDAFSKAWDALKNEKHPRLKLLADRAIGELLVMNSKLGRQEAMEPMIKSISGRDLGGTATELVSAAGTGLKTMRTRPEIAFRCGPMALAKICGQRQPASRTPEILLEAKSTARGTSLWQNHRWATEAGIPLQPVLRQKGAAVPFPAVIHWKTGHYAALTGFKDGRYLLEDGTFGGSLWITTAAIDDESSGYLLIPCEGADLPAGYASVARQEAEQVWGRGYVEDYDKDATTPCDKKTGCTKTADPGMATWNIHLLAVSLNITDTPLTYAPPVGPGPDLTITYNQRESNQPAILSYPNFGPKWTFGGISAIIDNPGQPYEDVKHYVAGGGAHRYTGFDLTTGRFDLQHRSRAILARTSSASYTLTHPDGTIDTFSQSDGVTVGTRRIFLTSRTDPRSNTLTYIWQNGKLTGIQDAFHGPVEISYHPTHPYRISEIEDPHGRSAIFGYDSQGRLISITDPADIKSEFRYGTGDFIDRLTTPYGATHFANGEVFDVSDISFNRWIEVTDPMGLRQRVEYREEAPGIAMMDYPLPAPASDFPEDALDGIIATTPLHWRIWRNTFHWDTKTMRAMNNDPTSDYTKAHIYQWLHSDDYVLAVPHLESEKPPLTNRIYYNYQGQTHASLLGTTSFVSKIATAIDILPDTDGQQGTSQISQFAYNTLGQPTRFIDPVGRETERVYAANDIDLLEIRQRTGVDTWETLATYANYTDHLPWEITDASGEITLPTWNSRGQLLTLTDPNNDTTTTTYTYDHRLNFNPATDTPSGYGYLYKIQGPVTGATTTFTYDSDGRIETVTDSEGHTVTLQYDDLDRLVRKTYPDATFEKFTYGRPHPDPNGPLLTPLDVHQYTDRLARTTTYLHNANRQLMVETDPEGRITQYDYCSCGSIKRLIDPNGNVTRWQYDIQGRPTEKILPDGTMTTHQYDPHNGRLLSSTDSLGQITHHTYHLDDNPHQTTFTNCVHLTPGHTWTWDPNFNRPATLTDGTGTTNWTYHPNDGSTPGAGQIHTINGPLTDDTLARTYDNLGRLETREIHGTANTLNRQFDALGRLEQEINRLGTFGYQYLNQTSLPEMVTYPDGHSTHLSYKPVNQDRRLERIEHRLANNSILAAHEYAHDDEGTINTWKQERSGLATRTWHYGYDAATRLTSAILKNPAETILKTHGWQYDPGNNLIASKTDADGLIPSTHNKLNQLTAQGSGPVRFAGTLDEPGTVKVNGQDAKMRHQTLFEAYLELSPGTHEIEIAATDFSENTTTQSYELQIANEAETQFSYDLNGNLTQRITPTGTTTYQWDALDQLITIIHPDTSRSEFTYDGLSRRVRIIEKDATSTVTSDKRHLWDDLTIVEERAADGSIVNKRFYPQGIELTTGPNAGTYTYRTDHLGSIREVVDSTGALAARYDYSAWGETELISGSFDLDFRYTGHYFHQPSGLHLALFRSYDAKLARWLSGDPIGEAGGMNLYAYCYGNPLNLYDPDGMTPVGTEGGMNYDQDNRASFAGYGWDALEDAADSILKLFGPVTDKDGNVIMTGTVFVGPGAFARIKPCPANSGKAYQPQKTQLAQGKPIMTQWGWQNSPAWNKGANTLGSASHNSTITNIGGMIPTRSEAISMIGSRGGVVVRIEKGHAPGGVSTHTYPHINYSTSSGSRATVRIQACD